jgi:5-formyltetrahydrofolate cyclo-ligase
MKEKEQLRKEIRARLNATSEEYRSGASASIALNVLTMPEVRDAKTILAYCSVGKEPATLALISKLLEDGKRVCLPLCVDRDEEGRRTGIVDAMEARVIKSFDDLVPGAYGIPEPSADTEMMLPEYVDLIILPCISCDRQCNRIGHGAGYYDKYLSKVRSDCFTLAMCYEEILADEIPTEPHDRPVDAVVTEKQIYRWRP